MSEKKIAARFQLSRPIQAHGEEVSVLELREPTAGDVFATGLPLRISSGANGEGEVNVSLPEMRSMLARLAGVPLSAIDSMKSNDVMRLIPVLLPFFMPEGEEDSEAQSTEPSTSPGSTIATPIPSLRSA